MPLDIRAEITAAIARMGSPTYYRLAKLSGVRPETIKAFVAGQQETLASDALEKLLPVLGLTIAEDGGLTARSSAPARSA